jgi:chromosome segregation ATPase
MAMETGGRQMTCPSDDLTKLSGPELAERIMGIATHDDVVEASRRLREDTREWQRNLERERDGLRAELAQCKATMAGMHAARGELQRECDQLQATVSRQHAELRELDDQRELLKITCGNQRKELHSLNVERAKTLTKLEEAQRRIAELLAVHCLRPTSPR